MMAIATGLAVIFWFTSKDYFLHASIIIGLIGLFSPFLSRLIAKAWFKLAEWLGLINGTILLSIIFLFILFPLALFTRLFNKLGIQLKKQSDPKASYYQKREYLHTAKDLKNPW